MSEQMNEQDLPKGWEFLLLEDLIQYVIGGDWGNDLSYDDNDYVEVLCIRGSEIRHWGEQKGKTASRRKISKSSLHNRILLEGDVLLEISGGGPEQPVGRTVLIDKEALSYDPKTPKVCTNFLRLIRFPTSINKKYINTYLQFFYHSGEVVKYQGGSNNLRNLKFSNYVKIKVPISPLNEQHRIIAKIEELFSELDNGIENLKQTQGQLKVYRQALLKHAFEGKLSGKEIKEDNLPEGWKWVNLKEICKIAGGVTKGKDFKGKETIYLPYLRVANVQDGYLDLKEVKTIEVLPADKEKYQLLYGDILYTEGGDKDKLGRGTIWKNEVQDCIHQNHIFRARPITEEIESKYIAYFSQTKAAKDYFFKWAKQTTNLASINITVLSTLPIPICSINEQRQIIQYLEAQFSIIDNLEQTITQSLQESAGLRQSILKKAFEGKLVAQDPNDEPASELLKHIQVEKVKYLEDKKANKKSAHKTSIFMSKQEKSVLEVLQASAEPLSAKEVWLQSKHKEDIEAFYAELKTIERKIKEVKKETEAFLSLADAD